MSKPITKEQIEDFEKFCKRTFESESDGYFSLCHYEPFEEMQEDEVTPMWEFCGDDDSHDIYALFGSMEKFAVEEHGHDKFYVVLKEEDDDRDKKGT
jgi:hypothetical protein